MNALLPAESDWRVFVDGYRYLDWQRREQAAVVGVPIIGGTLVRDFPPSPPVGIAGGFRDGELWLDAAALPPTLKSARHVPDPQPLPSRHPIASAGIGPGSRTGPRTSARSRSGCA